MEGKPINGKSDELLIYARQTVNELARHCVLQRYWNELAVVVKGSTSRGNTDQYSDVDLVLFCEEETRRAIVADYFTAHLTERQDGIFMFFPNGHYHAESYDQLRGYFDRQDFVNAWDYAGAIALHDPQARYPGIIQAGLKTLFADPLDLVKRGFLDLQLDLDWMRMPILRADGPATLLYACKLLGGIGRIAFLLDCRPYPADKWLFTYLGGTTFGRHFQTAVMDYYAGMPGVLNLVRDQPFEQNSLYQGAAVLIDKVAVSIREQYGEQAWLDRWYDYV